MYYFDDNEDYVVNRMSHGKLKKPSQPEPTTKSPIFNRGFREVRQRVEKGSKYTMSCFNCEHYYQAVGDKTEVCQNPEVLKYDMVVTETSIYCTKWELVKRANNSPTKSVKGLFKKR